MASGEGESSQKFNVSEPGSVHETTGASVSVRKKKKYNGEDHVDTYLLNQIAKHVKHEELGTLARDLTIEETTYSKKAAPKDQIWQVSRGKIISNILLNFFFGLCHLSQKILSKSCFL